MKCYHCDYENNDDAIYCKNCGLRVDGKIICPDCGQTIDCDSQFCDHCGLNLHNTAFADQNDKFYQVKKSNCNCGVFSIATIFFSLLFTFFIGITFTATSKSTDTNSLATSPINLNLYYYFGEIYKQLATIKGLELSDFSISHYYFSAILGTILSIAIILTVVILTIITLAKYVNNTKGKSEKPYFTYVIATYFSYIISLILFCALNGNVGYTTSDSASFKLNSLSILGSIATTICIILATISYINADHNLLDRFKSNTSFSILSIIVLVILAILVASPSITMQTNEEKISYNNLNAIAVLVTIFSFKQPIKSPVTGITVTPEPPIEIYTLLIITLILQIAIIVLSLVLVAKHINKLPNSDRPYTGIGESIILFIMSAVYMTLTIIDQYRFIEYLEVDETISVGLLLPILLTIFGAVNLVIAICNAIYTKRNID